MTGPLYAALHHWARTPHEWGYFDCMLAPADWVHARHGWDPAEGLRGTYGDPEICPVGRRYRADPEPILRGAYARLPLVAAPAPGDVALVAIRGQRFLSGALRLKTDHWAIKPEAGGVLVTGSRAITPVLIWGVGHAE